MTSKLLHSATPYLNEIEVTVRSIKCDLGLKLSKIIISILLLPGVVTSAAMAQTSAEQYFEQGNAALLKQLPDDAIASYTKAIELKPDYAQAYTNRGAAYLLKELYDKAIADSTKAIELNPKIDTAYQNRGRAYRGKGLYKQAMADFQEALAPNPMDPTVLKDLEGLINQEAGNGLIDQAIADCKDALSRSKGNGALQKQLDELLQLKMEMESKPGERSKYWRRTDQDAGQEVRPNP